MFILALMAPAAALPHPPPTADASDRIVCQFTIVTGSQIRQRICRTAKGWERIERENEEQVSHASFPSEDCRAATQGVFRCDPK